MLISGQVVTLYEKSGQPMVDEFNNYIYEETPVLVANVLIEPASNDAITSSIELYGKRVAYTLHIPKGDTHNWEDSTIEFYGEKWRTFVDCLIYDEHLTPLDWNKKIKVERYE